MTEYIAEQFQPEIKGICTLFHNIYPTKHVTPYMHCMMMHVSEFMQIHGALLPFTQQGLEKYNDQMTKDYLGHRLTVDKSVSCRLCKNKTALNI